ncbi:MmgE/PrpD family protein [Nocardioides alkalitolerans]|uniref:MmgE/PrpD family protein n=1 Tax=Nocardioides alkalitolerans TaxID=281714 RepID=UPI000420D97F|nr:MmgE/PrpD family protein [Nocardioides alkalitolerans]
MTDEPTLTSQAIARARSIDHRSDDVVQGALHCLLDTLGVAIAGAHEPVTSLVRAEVLEEGGTPRATLWGTGEAVTRAQAALVNGTAAHALDFDDVSALMEGHPSAPVLPALLALAEGEAVTGDDLIAAFVTGFETQALVGRLMSPSHYATGFHTTATVGAFGAAAAGARLLGLSDEAWLDTFGIVGSRASGLKSMFGTMSKPLQVGAAAESGMRAVLLARRGVTADRDVLASPQGFRATQSDALGVTPEWAWSAPAVTKVLFKHHAACYLTHSAIEGMLSLRRSGLTPDDVESIELAVPPGHLSVCNISEPATPLEGKFSLRFTAAMALVEGDLTESAFALEHLTDPRVVALRDRVTVEPRRDSTIRSSVVTVNRRDKGTIQVEVDVNRPTPADDLTLRWESLVRKFRSLVEPVLGQRAASRIIEEVSQLPTAPSVEPLLDALTSPNEETAS